MESSVPVQIDLALIFIFCWFLTAVSLLSASIGLHQWTIYLRNSRFNSAIRSVAIVLGISGLGRLAGAIIGTVQYLLGHGEAMDALASYLGLVSIIFTSIVSLALAIVVNRETLRVRRMSDDRRTVLVQATNALENLRRA